MADLNACEEVRRARPPAPLLRRRAHAAWRLRLCRRCPCSGRASRALAALQEKEAGDDGLWEVEAGLYHEDAAGAKRALTRYKDAHRKEKPSKKSKRSGIKKKSTKKSKR